jgi:hypothetical protein
VIEAAKGNRHGHRDATMIPAHLSSRAAGGRGLRPALGPGSHSRSLDQRRRPEALRTAMATMVAAQAGTKVSRSPKP